MNMENMEKKSLTIPYFKDLDSIELEEVGNFLEQEAEKHIIDCRNWPEQFPYHPITVFMIARSDKYIYIDYFVRCNYLRAMNYTNNSPVSEDSCVEFFMNIPGNEEYWNFEFNCIGTTNASHRVTREHPIRLTDGQIAQIRRYASCGTRPFEEMEGLFAWELMIAIPFSLIGLDAAHLPSGLRGNFYKCGTKTASPHFLSWAPIATEKPDYHRPEFFGDLIFEK